MVHWKNIKTYAKRILLILCAALLIYILCGIVCVTWDRYYYTHVSTCVVIDETLADVPELNINAHEEIDRYLNFAFDYFKRNFRVKFIVTNHLNVSFNRLFDFHELRPKGEKLVIAMTNAALRSHNEGGGKSYPYSFSIQMLLSFHENNEAYKWILIHELCHQFNAIDLRDSDSIMNGNQFHVMNENGEYTPEIKAIEPHAMLPLDPTNRKIIEISKDEYATTNHPLFEYPDTILKDIIDGYDELLPLTKFPGNVNVTIGNFFFLKKDYRKSLNYFLNSLQQSPDEKYVRELDATYNELKGAQLIKDEAKYVAIVRNYFLLEDWDNVISYAEHLPAEGESSLDKYKFSSVAYESKGEIDSAIDAMERYVKLKTDDFSTWYYLGCLYLQRVPKTVWKGDDIDRAVDAFNKTQELNPNHILTTFHLAALYSGNGSKEKAQEYLTKLKSDNFDFNTLIKKKDGPVQLHISDG